jgi:hypothetical protein
VFDNRGLGPKGDGESYIMRSFVICTPCQVLLNGRIKEDKTGRACSTHGREGMRSFGREP